MRILLLTPRFPNPVQTWFCNQILALQAHNADIDIGTEYLTDHELDRDTYRYTEVVPLPWAPRRILAACIRAIPRRGKRLPSGRIAAIFRLEASLTHRLKWLLMDLFWIPFQHHYDVIHAHSEYSAYRMAPLAHRAGKVFVLTFHGLPPDNVPTLTRQQRTLMFGFVDRVLVNTGFARDQYIALGCPGDRISVIPQGISTEAFAFQPRTPDWSRPLELLTVGRLDPLKGVQFVIQAVAMLESRGIDVRYTVVGEGGYRNELSQLAAELGVADRVRFTGHCSQADIAEQLHAADIFVLPSFSRGRWAETQGIVIQEAQAAGTLTVASASGGIVECIQDGINGFIFEAENAASLVEKIVAALEHRSDWSTWLTNARHLVEDKYSLARMGDSLTGLYDATLSVADRAIVD